jgi:hypothetical protein
MKGHSTFKEKGNLNTNCVYKTMKVKGQLKPSETEQSVKRDVVEVK